MKNYLSVLTWLLIGLFPWVGQAATQPKFSIVPLTPTAIELPINGTATVTYLVTNHTALTRFLTIVPIKGVRQQTNNAVQCSNPFVLAPHQSCELTLQLKGSELTSGVIAGPVICKTLGPNQPIPDPLLCSRANPTNQLTVTLVSKGLPPPPDNQPAMLTASVSSLALSIACLPSSTCTATQNVALTGKPRQITIQNIGLGVARNVVVSATDLPSGTVISENTCSGTLAAGASCLITLTPGSVASRDATLTLCTSGTPPVESLVTVTADNTSPTVISVVVLGYGCQYQSGYVFAIDDTTSITTSVGGTVLSLEDNSTSIPWNDESPMITSAQNLTNGAENTATIIAIQGAGNYAAQTCANLVVDSYADWYLPAICQLGPAGQNAGCSLGGQNVVDNLAFLVSGSCNGSACLTDEYWSSTEISTAAENGAWVEQINLGGSSQLSILKGISRAVRCSRALFF